MNIRPGIKLLNEIEGYGDPIGKGDRFEAVYKYYRNKGEPIILNVVLHPPIPKIEEIDGECRISWMSPNVIKSNVIYDYSGWLTRQSGLPPGLYYSLLGMKRMGYRHVKIAPHFLSNSIFDDKAVKKNSVIKVEIFLIKFGKSVL